MDDKTRHRRSLVEKDLLRMNIPRRFWDVTFSGITDHVDDDGLSLKMLVHKYLDNFGAMFAQGAGLLLWGNNGLGKTGAIAVLAKESRRRGKSVLFMTASEYLEAIHGKMGFDAEMTFVGRAKSVDVLVIDDFGKEHKDNKGWGERQFEELVRHRSANVLVTMFTMNVPMETFSRVAVRSMVQVLKECTYPFEVVGPDRRVDGQGEIERVLAG